MMNESKKLKEVWKWKDDVYEKTKGMTRDERIAFFNNALDNFTKKTGLKIAIEKKDRQKVVTP
jgi:hypothetical protein